jgi:hypothetical protein
MLFPGLAELPGIANPDAYTLPHQGQNLIIIIQIISSVINVITYTNIG